MPVLSAGLLMFRKFNDELEFFLIHPGGPFWAKKHEGAWSIPKGLAESTEELLDTAKREFKEETGIEPLPPFYNLGSVKLKSGKIIHAWSFEGQWDSKDGITSNHIQIEWPPRSKKFISIPEADKGEWMNVEKASVMINQAQQPLLIRARDLVT